MAEVRKSGVLTVCTSREGRLSKTRSRTYSIESLCPNIRMHSRFCVYTIQCTVSNLDHDKLFTIFLGLKQKLSMFVVRVARKELGCASVGALFVVVISKHLPSRSPVAIKIHILTLAILPILPPLVIIIIMIL